jgi:hypothetical protein
MPKRAEPGERERLEAALTPSLRAALHELRELLDVWDWQASPLAAPFQQAAAILEAVRVVDTRAAAEKDALEVAAARLGLSADTLRSRARRWPDDSRSLCTPTDAAGRATLDRKSRTGPALEGRP